MNKSEEAKAVVRKIAKFNKVHLSENVFTSIDVITKHLQIRKTDGKPYSVGDWFHIVAIRRYIIFSCWIW